jgi:outer membrane immunogenic protein
MRAGARFQKVLVVLIAGLWLLTVPDAEVRAGQNSAVTNWNGLYLGAHAGGGWAFNEVTRTDASSAPNFPLGFVDTPSRPNGFLGGGYAGYNYQAGRYVVGLEADYSWANLSGDSSDVGFVGNTAYRTDKVVLIATAGARLGYTFDRWMMFGKGGWGWAGFKRDSFSVVPGGALFGIANYSDTRNGWLLGAGVEWEFRPQWSLRLAFDYIQFSDVNLTINVTQVATGIMSTSTVRASSSLSTLKIGIGRRF